MSRITDRVHQTWITSERPIPTNFVRPLMRFTQLEASGGFVLLAAAILALVWANSPVGQSYTDLWESHITIGAGPLHFDHSLKDVVNDALMAIFFFVVGLEIKRELVVGDLNDRKRAALPAIAALGGMVFPALIYVAFVAGSDLPAEAMRGWGIPMATDIAFSVGVISLLGTRISTGAKLFLLALAIADDIGAIVVIAVFYTSDLALGWLGLALAGLLTVYVGQRVGIRSLGFYWVVGIAVWFCVFESGVHATLAGVALGLMTPVWPWYSDDDYYRRAKLILDRFEMESADPRGRDRVDFSALSLASVSRESVSPLDRLETAIHPWSSFLIVPIFALANAGVRFTQIDVGEALTSAVSLGVAFGLVAGKTIGITLATWLAVRFGAGKLPRRTGFRQVVGLAAIAGIGFTVSLFVTELAFEDEFLTDAAKMGIFLGSLVAGVIGYAILKGSPTPEATMHAGLEMIGLEGIDGRYDPDLSEAALEPPAPS
ncbi:MAG TPA: Na+/H+ antiporter NhaA [Acidimicrobiia bacterium]|jgi:NhaA family Na+:H+ antiporter